MDPQQIADEIEARRPVTNVIRIGRFLSTFVKEPVLWIRENIVEPNRGPKYYWYHRKYERAVPIDECYVDDYACMHEANQEFLRNRMVDRATLELLKFRSESCSFWHSSENREVGPKEACQELIDTYERERVNYTIKYGEMKYGLTAVMALNKQKHRMIVERRRAAKESEKRQEEKETDSS